MALSGRLLPPRWVRGIAVRARTTPGRRGSLSLHRMTLSFTSPCRFGPAHKETTMPELLIDFITSLDGYGAADGWPGWWGLEGPEYLAWLGEQPEADHTVLMGATTYRVMAGLAAEG